MRHFLFAFFLLIPAFSIAADASDRLSGMLSNARTMTASFEQTITGGNGAVTQQSTGVMSVSRPHLFRWEVKSPFEQLIIADGKQVWVYDPDLLQAVVRPFDQQLSDTPALLFSGDAKKINQRFDVSLMEEKGDVVRFDLKPRGEDNLFEVLRVGFKAGKLREMALLDNLGQKTRIYFNDVKLNPAVPASKFVFTPPPGTDVIREAN